jgi:predicted amidohydrolase
MKIGLIQMDVIDDKSKNLSRARRLIGEAVDQGAQIIVLPEMFTTPYSNDKFRPYAEDRNGLTVKWMKDIAKEYGVLLIGGSIPEIEGEKLYNTAFIVDEEGLVLGRHRKMHLFDIDVPGKIRFMESDTLTPGEETTVLDTKFGKIGVAVCYDMRFPELFRKMTLMGAEMIFIPAAFNTTTGPLHWQVLTRARALDNQVFLAIASPARSKVLDYKAYGHSLVVDPWGQIEDELDQNEGILVVDIDMKKLEQVRQEIPVLKHRRTQLY